MLSQRKRYNYNVGSSICSTRTRPPAGTLNNQNPDTCTLSQSKRIAELESANKRMLEDTTRQFQKFEEDVLKVESILRAKQQQNDQLERENRALHEDKAQLIDALKQKQLIIQEFHAKFKQLLSQKQAAKQEHNISTSCQTQPSLLETSGCQTEPDTRSQQLVQLQCQSEGYCQKYKSSLERTSNLEEEVYRLKQQLYVATNQLSLVKQEFSTYKLLNEIEQVKNS